MPRGIPNKKKGPAIPYEASLKIAGKVFKSSGVTLQECLSTLKIGTLIKLGGLLSVKHGDKSKDRILTPFQTVRLFNGSRVVKEVALKNISILFGGL